MKDLLNKLPYELDNWLTEIELSEKVKTVVLQVINEEQRTGGSLSKTKVAR